MNTLSEIKNKILKSSNLNEIENLISLRAFLLEESCCPWIILENENEIENALSYFESKENSYFYNKNIKNIKKLNIEISDLFLPLNKKLCLIEILNDIIKSLIFDEYILVDKIRCNPLNNDTLYQKLIDFEKCITINKINLYKKRNQDLKSILSQFGIENCNPSRSAHIASTNKLKNLWSNTWGKINYYSNEKNNIIDKILI